MLTSDSMTYVRTERVRAGFQPHWRTVFVFRCRACGRDLKIAKNWGGTAPAMRIDCPRDHTQGGS